MHAHGWSQNQPVNCEPPLCLLAAPPITNYVTRIDFTMAAPVELRLKPVTVVIHAHKRLPSIRGSLRDKFTISISETL